MSRFGFLLLVVLSGCPKSDGSTPASTLQLETLPVGDPACPAGGVRLVGPGDERRAVCNGTSAAAATVTITALGAGDATCPHGGARFDAAGTSSFACSGAPGAAPTLTPLPVGDASCPHGGTRLDVGGASTSLCNGAPGVEGPVGPVGAAGDSVTSTPLATGDAACPQGGTRFTVGGVSTVACNGLPGSTGPAGASVVVTPLAPGDANCPFGGAQFSVGSSVGRACNASLPPGALGQGALVLTGGTPTPITFTRGALGVETDIVEQRVVGPTGQESIRLVPGASRLREVVLVGRLGASRELWAWREQVLAGSSFRRDVSLEVSNGGPALLQVSLTAAWPTAIRQRRSLAGAEYEVTLAASALAVTSLGTGASTSSPVAVLGDPARFPSAGVPLTGVDGPESSHEVVTMAQADGGTLTLPGRLTHARLTFTRPVTGEVELFQWYQAMRTNPAAARSASLTLRGPAPAEWTFFNALPFAWTLTLGDDGRPTESLLVGSEGTSRIQ